MLRLSVVAGCAIFLAALIARPWRWTEDDWKRVAQYDPSPRAISIGALLAGLLLFWIVLALFQSGHINAVDFTVYFDRPLYQTIHGRPIYVETSVDAAFEYQTHLAVHAYWLLVPLSMLYGVHASPMWLHALSVIAVVAGGVFILRIGRRAEFGGLVSCAAAIALLLNGNTARALRYGFHPEVLYVWFVPWMLDAGLRGAKRPYLAAAILCILVKEDACLPLFAAAVALALIRGSEMTRGDRLFFLGVPTALALANLALFYGYVVPALSPTRSVMYASLWTYYGPTPIRALLGMATHPLSVARDVLTSGFARVLSPFLFLPLIGWRWSIGTLPIFIIFGASTDYQLRDFALYYAISMVPFLTLAGSAGALALAQRMVRPTRAAPVAAALILAGALVVGRGYALRHWATEIAAVPRAMELLADERIVLVQSGLYPHAGYSHRVQLLTPHALRDPANAGAAIVIAPRINAYPFRRRELRPLLDRPPIVAMPGGLVAVRNHGQ